MSKNVLITGAGRRIGRAIAAAFARNGWNIVLHYRSSKDEAAALKEELASHGGSIILLKADLQNPAEASQLIPEANKALGPLLCLVNNAAIFERDTIDDATAASFERHMNINLLAPLLLTQAFARQIPNGKQGNVINIADQRIFNLRPDFLSYNLSKTGLWTLTQTTAMALAPHIRVNAIGPGPTLANTRQTTAQFKQQQLSVPLRYGPTPDEIASAVLFILEAKSMTGEFISLDGGQHLPIYQTEGKEDLHE